MAPIAGGRRKSRGFKRSEKIDGMEPCGILVFWRTRLDLRKQLLLAEGRLHPVCSNESFHGVIGVSCVSRCIISELDDARNCIER